MKSNLKVKGNYEIQQQSCLTQLSQLLQAGSAVVLDVP